MQAASVSWFVVCLAVCFAVGHARAAEPNCQDARPPIFIVPGVMGSELLGVNNPQSSRPPFYSDLNPAASTATANDAPAHRRMQHRRLLTEAAEQSGMQQEAQQTTSLAAAATPVRKNPCPKALNADKLRVFLPLDLLLANNTECFYYMMRLKYNKGTGRFSNNTSTAVAADLGGPSGMDSTAWSLGGYSELVTYLTTNFNYTPGTNLFGLPYDWRYDFTAMQQTGALDHMAKRIAAAVRANCGQKAILIAHSMGASVALELLQNPRLAAWRKTNVKAYIALAPAYGGVIKYTAMSASGDPIEGLHELFPEFDLEPWFYEAMKGLPSPVMFLPYGYAYGDKWVVATTPTRNYTVAQQTEFLSDIGDMQAVSMYSRVRRLRDAVSRGPVPNIPMYCIYGAAKDTAKTYSFESLVPGKMAAPPKVVVYGKGDGSVNIESMRLCNRFTTADHITELTDDTSHMTVVSGPTAQAAIGKYLRELLKK